jgi:signal transduction histidine kinase
MTDVPEARDNAPEAGVATSSISFAGVSVPFSELDAIFNRIPDRASPAEVQEALRAILVDDTLEVYWWDREGERYVDIADEPVVPAARPGRVLTPVEYASRKVGLFAHAPDLLDRPWFLPVFVPTMRIAMERDRLTRDLGAKLDQLRASRQRLIEASMAERRRLERNLHDGAQQRLVVVLLRLRDLEAHLAAETELAELARETREGLELALSDLRELARGLQPPLLAQHGLAAAVRWGASRSTLPVELDLQVDEKLPDVIEEAAYYVAAEAITNAVKHSGADLIRLRIAQEGQGLTVVVEDDGIGGASLSPGDESTGLSGLRDRLEALDGTFALESAQGGGTRLVAVFPLAPARS